MECAKCGSKKIAQRADVLVSVERVLVKVEADPQSRWFKGTVSRQLFARVCGNCGYTELFVQDPDEVYEAYAKAHESDLPAKPSPTPSSIEEAREALRKGRRD